MIPNEPSELEINKIIKLVSKGLFQEALNDAKIYSEKYPDNALFQNITGACYGGLGKFNEAVLHYQKAIEIKPDYARAHYNLAGTFQDMGHLKKAVKSYKKSIEIEPGFGESHNNLGNVYKELQQSEDAINSYKKAIQINPNYVEALYSLSNLLQNIDNQTAIEYLEKVINIKSKFVEAHNNLGILYRNQGRLIEAVQSYENALAINSNFGEAHNNLGNVYRDLNQLDEAVESYQKAISLKPDYPSTYNNLGNVLKDLDQLDEAIELYHKALKINPDNFEILNNLGNALTEIEQFEDAIEVFKKATAINSDYADAFNNLGVAFKKIGRIDDAIEAYEKAIAINSDFADAYNNLGISYKKIGRIDDAIESYEMALTINPNDSDTLNNIGITLIDSERLDEAIKCYKKALSITPDYADALNNLSIAFMKLKRFDEAYKANEKALILRPNYAEGFAVKGRILTEQRKLDKALLSFNRANEIDPNLAYNLGAILNTKMNLCNWDDLPHLLKDLKDKINLNQKVIVPFDLLGLVDDAELQKKTSEIYANDNFPENHTLSKIYQYQKHSKIRIGYFSADFKMHPVAMLTAELYEIHDRSQFEVHAFSFGPDTNDEMNLRIKAGVDHFHDVHNKSDKDITVLSRSKEIDIAIDLGGYTADSRTGIFAMRAAPIQASYIGVLSTMGSEYYDYLIAGNGMISKENQLYFSEKIIYLPSYQVNDSKEQEPEIYLTRQDLGLPETGFVFCCLNNTYKITPEVFNSWMRIIKKVDRSVLLIYTNSETAKINLRKEVIKQGIDFERVIFGDNLPRAEYLARYRVVDLFLDTHPYNAGTTASDALRMGLPIITLKGNSFNAREAESIIRAVNMPEMIVQTSDEYESKAIELANNPKKYELLKKKLASNLPNAPLFDTAKFAKNLESAFIKIYDNHQKGLDPDHVYIEELNEET